jgi:hypothetical protein
MPQGRHRLSRPLRRTAHVARIAAVAATATTATAGFVGIAPVAHADITRCVGVEGQQFAFACYTSPRFNHSGFDNTTVATFPTVCYAIGCTTEQVVVLTPDQSNVGTGRFTAVSYLGHSYTVYRPAASQPYVVTSDNPRATDADNAQALAISALLDTANGG